MDGGGRQSGCGCAFVRVHARACGGRGPARCPFVAGASPERLGLEALSETARGGKIASFTRSRVPLWEGAVENLERRGGHWEG